MSTAKLYFCNFADCVAQLCFVCVTFLSSRMLPGPLMMYQFQRSFIKAASEFVDVCGISLKEEQNLQAAEHNLYPAALSLNPCS